VAGGTKFQLGATVEEGGAIADIGKETQRNVLDRRGHHRAAVKCGQGEAAAG